MTTTTDTEVQRRQLVNGGDPNQEYFVPPKELFSGGYLPAGDLQRIADALLEARPEDLAAHVDYSVVYLWKEKGGSSQGKLTLGKTTLARGLLRHFAQVDFVIWLAADHLHDIEASKFVIEAVVYHEMLHVIEGDDGPSLRPHDFTGFAEELKHYGDYLPDLMVARKAFEQIPLFADDYVQQFQALHDQGVRITVPPGAREAVEGSDD